MRSLAIFGLLLGLTACAMPSTVVRTPDTRPSLAFPDAPQGSVLFLDGRQIGEASAYDGQPKVLVVEPGTHVVLLKTREGAVLLERTVYVESELKTLTVH
ncbi:MAG: hypothetical protein HY900_08150 [Deltaproteobacteria bacterium]|nr:hypothetical protein [Deltaproteobacteria bacterium]